MSTTLFLARYRKRPVEVAAACWLPDNSLAVREMRDWLTFHGADFYVSLDTRILVIETLEGPMSCTEGSFVIRGVAGEFYPCKPDIFEATYEAVDA